MTRPVGRPPSCRRDILAALSRGSGLDASTLSERLGWSLGSVLNALSKMKIEGNVERTSPRPRIWTITPAGRQRHAAFVAREREEQQEEQYA